MYNFISWSSEIFPNQVMTIEGDNFERFLSLIFNNAKYFSLNTSRWDNSTNKSARRDLHPFLIKSFKTKRWFGYDYTNAPKGFEREIEVQLYEATVEAKNVIVKYFNDIFLEEKSNSDNDNSTQDLEDLCFFTDVQTVLYTISHENILVLNSLEEDILNEINKFGKWDFKENNLEDSIYMSLICKK